MAFYVFNTLVDSLPLMNVNQSPIEVFRIRDLGILADLIVHSLGKTPWTDLSNIDSDGLTIYFIIIHIKYQKIDDETHFEIDEKLLTVARFAHFFGTPGIHLVFAYFRWTTFPVSYLAEEEPSSSACTF